MAAYGLLSEGTMEGASSCLMLFASPFTKFGGVVDSWLNSCAWKRLTRYMHDHRQPAKNLAWPNVQNHQIHFPKWLHFYTCMAHVPNISLSCSTFARAMPCFILLGKALDFTSRTLVCFWMCSNERESARKLSRIAKASVPTLCEQIRYLTFTSRGALAHAKNKHICHKTGHKWYTFGFCDLLRFFSACFLSGFARHDWDCSGLILASFSENLSNIAPEIAKKFICS